jgi:hypothetical protein
MMLNPWIFGLESVQQGWQAQSAMAFRLMRLFGGGVPDQTTSILIQDTLAVVKAQEEAPAAIADEQEAPAAIADKQEAPAAIADARRRKAPKVLRVSKSASRANPPSVSKRAAAASQSRALKAVRRSARKPR